MNFRFRMRWNGTGLCAGIATAYKCNVLATTGRQQDPTASCPDPVALAPRTSLGNNIGAPLMSSGFRSPPSGASVILRNIDRTEESPR
jgi:hypothetical protein